MTVIDPVGARASVMTLLDQAVRTVDEMWRSAQVDSDLDATVVLGEASHGIHRALIALESLATLRA